MTRWPKLHDLIYKFYGKKPSTAVNPDEAVAAGAALQANILRGGMHDVLLLDVTPLSLGVELEDGTMARIVPRNSTIPIKKSQTFQTAENNQTQVTVKIYQGERPIANDNKLLGEFELFGIPPAPRGQATIEVTFDIDSNGIVNVHAKELKTKKAANITVASSGGLSQDDITRLVEESERLSVDDNVKVEIAQMKARAKDTVMNTEQAMNEHGHKISDGLKQEVSNALHDLQSAIDGLDPIKVKDCHEHLQRVTSKIGMELLGKAKK